MRKCKRIQTWILLTALCLALFCACALGEGTGEGQESIPDFYLATDSPEVNVALIPPEAQNFLSHNSKQIGIGIYSIETNESIPGTGYTWTVELLEGTEVHPHFSLGHIFAVAPENVPDSPCDATYRVTCHWGGKTASIDLTLHFIAIDPPTGTTLQDYYTVKAGEYLEITLDFIPRGWEVPGRDDNWYTLGGDGIENPGDYTINERCNALCTECGQAYYADELIADWARAHGEEIQMDGWSTGRYTEFIGSHINEGFFCANCGKEYSDAYPHLFYVVTSESYSPYIATFRANTPGVYRLNASIRRGNIEPNFQVIILVTDENEEESDMIPIDEEHFPDEVLRGYLAERYGIRVGDATVCMASDVTEIVLPRSGLTSVQGIEYFPNLETLVVYQNELTELDVSQNPALNILSCGENSLSGLNISQNPALERVWCYSNPLRTLDASRHSELVLLSCWGCQLSSLDVTDCPSLEYLYCHENQLTGLNLTGCSAIYYLYCYENQLSGLNVTSCPALYCFYCNNNQLTALDVSQNAALNRLQCDDNRLTVLNLSHNPALTHLTCSGMDVEIIGLIHDYALLPNDYELIPKSADELLQDGVTVYLDLDFWGIVGTADRDGNTAPRLVPVTDDTEYRDPAVAEGEPEDWVSARYIYETYLASGKEYEEYASSYLYVKKTVNEPDFILPAGLKTIEEEAFSGIAAEIVLVPAGCEYIAPGAFANCPNLKTIIVPANCVVAEGACGPEVSIVRQ